MVNPQDTVKRKETRRKFIGKVSGWIIGLGLFGQLAAYIRSLIPNVLYEPAKKFKIGQPTDYTEGVKFIEDRRIFVFKEKKTFYTISAICTHLGCTVKHSPLSKPQKITIKGETKLMSWEFRCPCHGSIFYGDGTVKKGPAPKPLPWHPLEVSPDDGQIVVDVSKKVDKKFRLVV